MKTNKCPVCDWEIKDGGINVSVGGKQITVCCEDCARKAKASPCEIPERVHVAVLETPKEPRPSASSGGRGWSRTH